MSHPMESSQTKQPLKTSQDFYREGNVLRQQGDIPGAMNCYMEAIHLNPESPAVEAMRMMEDIMNFYCKDLYNP